MTMTRAQNAIAGWKKAIELNDEHIRRKQSLVDAGGLRPEQSGIVSIEHENKMYRKLIASMEEEHGL